MILSNFRKTRIVSYRIFFKNLEKKKQRIKLSNLLQIKKNNKNFGIKTDFFKQILRSTIFLFLFLKRSRRIVLVFYVYYWATIRWDLFRNKNKKIVLCSICLNKSVFIPKFLFFIFIWDKFDSLIRCFVFCIFKEYTIRYDLWCEFF